MRRVLSKFCSTVNLEGHVVLLYNLINSFVTRSGIIMPEARTVIVCQQERTTVGSNVYNLAI